jgi:hypothetical protein
VGETLCPFFASSVTRLRKLRLVHNRGAHRVASGDWRNQALEIDYKGWILYGFPLAPTALLADSPRRSRCFVANIGQSAINRGPCQAGNLRHQIDAAMTHSMRFQSHEMPSALLVQNRRHLQISLAGSALAQRESCCDATSGDSFL